MISGKSRWHYEIDGETMGPVDLAVLRVALQARAGEEARVRGDGSDEWRRPSEVPGLLGSFAGPADPDWPNSPTKVFLYLAMGIVAFDLDRRYRVPVVLPGAAVAIAYGELRGRGSRPALAVPLACVIGLACAFAISDATVFEPSNAAKAGLDVLAEVLLPLALAVWYLARPSAVALLFLLGLEGVTVALYAVAASDWDAGTVPPLAAHAVALLGFARIAGTSRPPRLGGAA